MQTERTGWSPTLDGAWNPAAKKGQSWADFSKGANGGAGFNWGIKEPHNFAQEFAQKTGFQGNPLQQGAPTSFYEGESGQIADPSSSWAINPEFEKHLGQYTWEGGASGGNQHPWARAYDPSGALVGQFTTGDNGSRSVDAAYKAAIAAMIAAGAWGQFGPGAGGSIDPMTSDLGIGSPSSWAGPDPTGGGIFPEAAGPEGWDPGPLSGDPLGGEPFVNSLPPQAPAEPMSFDNLRLSEAANQMGGPYSGSVPSGVDLGSAGGVMSTEPSMLSRIAGVLGQPMKDFLPNKGSVGATLLQAGLPALLGKLGSGGGPPGFPSGGGGTGGGGAGGGAAGGAVDPLTTNQAMIDAIMAQHNRYLDPQKAEEWRSLEGRLAAQGMVQGTPAYAQAKEQFDRTWERRYADARDRAVGQGTLTGFNQALQSNQTAFDQWFRQANAQYGAGLDQYNAKTGARNDLTNQIAQLMAALYMGGP